MLHYKRSSKLIASKNCITFSMLLDLFKFDFKFVSTLNRFLSWENLGHASKTCSMLKSVLQGSHSGGGCLVIRYSWVSREWPVRMRVRAAWFFLDRSGVLCFS